MVGYVQDAIAKALRNWPALAAANIMPVRSVDGSSVVVNTPLPAIVVHVVGTDGEGNTYFGGGIRQYFELELQYICDVPNFTFSEDGGMQAERLDMSDEIIRCIEQTSDLDELKQKHDFNAQFDRMETEQTYGSSGSMAITVDVHKVFYKCDVEFDPRIDASKRYADLKRVEVETSETKSIIE